MNLVRIGDGAIHLEPHIISPLSVDAAHELGTALVRAALTMRDDPDRLSAQRHFWCAVMLPESVDAKETVAVYRDSGSGVYQSIAYARASDVDVRLKRLCLYPLGAPITRPELDGIARAVLGIADTEGD